MEKKIFFNTRFAKVLVIALVFVCVAVMGVGGNILLTMADTGVGMSQTLEGLRYERTTAFTDQLIDSAYRDSHGKIIAGKFLNGKDFDQTQTVDISNISSGIHAAAKDSATTYALADLYTIYTDGNAYQNLSKLNDYSFIDDSIEDAALSWSDRMYSNYDIDFYYMDHQGNVYGTTTDMDWIESIGEALEQVISTTDNNKNSADETDEEYDSIVAIYRLDNLEPVLVTETDISNNEVSTDTTLTNVGNVTAYIVSQLDLSTVNWDVAESFNPDNYGDTFWNFYYSGKSVEIVLPESQESIADYALKHPHTVSIMDTYKQLYTAVTEVGSTISDLASTDATASTTEDPLSYYWFHNATANIVITNNPDWSELNYASLKQLLESNENLPAAGYSSLDESDWSSIAQNLDSVYLFTGHLQSVFHQDDMQYQVVVSANETIMDQLSYYIGNSYTTYSTLYPYITLAIAMAACGFAGMMILCAIAIIQAGRRDDSKNRYASTFAVKTPIELLAILDIICWAIFAGITTFIVHAYYTLDNWPAKTTTITVWLAVGVGLALWQLLTLVCKGKSYNMLTNSLIKRYGGKFVELCTELYNSRKSIGKLLIRSILFVILNGIGLIIFLRSHRVGLAYLLILWLVIFILLLLKARQHGRVIDGIHKIASGDLDFQIDTTEMSGDYLQLSEDLNNVRDGMKNAIDEQMKSERLRTDLITNVSHDIKTPLTSIINYVDILKRENIQDEKIRSYIDILDTKSQRLKHLTEDLVEASKISSGNINLEFQNINLKQLIKQSNGEFEEKFQDKNLSLVCSLPEEDLIVHADSRRMWRIIENLYNNACKYSMPYTRVYVDGFLRDDKVIITIKNISEYPLNISADELMERFVRGDVSRNTEGSGLGLEIARNLAVMMGGGLDIQLDGDLFKVILNFSQVSTTVTPAE